MREIRTSGSMRGSGRKALHRKCHLSLSTLPVKKSGFFVCISILNYLVTPLAGCPASA